MKPDENLPIADEGEETSSGSKQSAFGSLDMAILHALDIKSEINENRQRGVPAGVNAAIALIAYFEANGNEKMDGIDLLKKFEGQEKSRGMLAYRWARIINLYRRYKEQIQQTLATQSSSEPTRDTPGQSGA